MVGRQGCALAAACRQMRCHEWSLFVVEDVERRAGAWIDLDQVVSSLALDEICTAQPHQADAPAQCVEPIADHLYIVLREGFQPRRSAIAIRPVRHGRCPLMAETYHPRTVAISHEERGNAGPGDLALEVYAGCRINRACRRDMQAARAANALGEPALRICGAIVAGLRKGYANFGTCRRQRHRVLSPAHHLSARSGYRKGFSQLLDQFRMLLEA